MTTNFHNQRKEIEEEITKAKKDFTFKNEDYIKRVTQLSQTTSLHESKINHHRVTLNSLDSKYHSWLEKSKKNITDIKLLFNTKIDKSSFFKIRNYIDQDFNNFKIDFSHYEKRLQQLDDFKKEYKEVFEKMGGSEKIIETIKNIGQNENGRSSKRFITKEFLSKMTLRSNASSKMRKSRRFSRMSKSRLSRMVDPSKKMESLMPPIPDSTKRKSYQTRERKSKLRPPEVIPKTTQNIRQAIPRDSFGANSSMSASSKSSKNACKPANKVLIRKKSIFQTFQNELSKKESEVNSFVENQKDLKKIEDNSSVDSSEITVPKVSMSKEESVSSSGAALKPKTVMEIRNISDPRTTNKLAPGKPLRERRDSFYLKSNTTKIRDIGNHLDIHITDLTKPQNTPRIEAIRIPEINKNMIEEHSYNSEGNEEEDSEYESDTIEQYVEKLHDIAQEAVDGNNKYLRQFIDKKISKEEFDKLVDEKFEEVDEDLRERLKEFEKQAAEGRKKNEQKIETLGLKITDFIQKSKIERQKDLYDLHCEIQDFYAKTKKLKLDQNLKPEELKNKTSDHEDTEDLSPRPKHYAMLTNDNMTQISEDLGLSSKINLQNMNSLRKSIKRMFSPDKTNLSTSQKSSNSRLIRPITQNLKNLKNLQNSSYKKYCYSPQSKIGRNPKKGMKLIKSRDSSISKSMFSNKKMNHSLPKLR